MNERHDFVNQARALRPDAMRRLINAMPGESPIDLERHAACVVLTLHDLHERALRAQPNNPTRRTDR